MKKILLILLVLIAGLSACVSRETSTGGGEFTFKTEGERIIRIFSLCLEDLAFASIEEKRTSYTAPTLEKQAYEYTFESYERRIDGVLLELSREVDTWQVNEESNKVFVISGKGLGHKEQLCYGEWYYYQASGAIEPISIASKELKDLITLEGLYQPQSTGVYPEDGLTYVHPNRVTFIWQPQVPTGGYLGSYEAVVIISTSIASEDQMAGNEYSIFEIVNDPLFVCDKPLDYGSTYYWQVHETGYDYDSYGKYGGKVKHPIRSFKTMPLPSSQQLEEKLR